MTSKNCRMMLAVLCLAALLWPSTGWTQGQPVVITQKDKGRTFTVKVGQKLVVDLRHPGDGGYDVLSPKYDGKVLKLLGQRRKPRKDPRLMGDFGRVIYEFTGLKAGQTDLVIPIKRHWEKHPKDYLKVKIKVVR